MDRRTVLKTGLAAGVASMAVPALEEPAVAADDLPGYPEFPYPPTDYREPLRGQFHFSARYGWMNDPNGLVYHDGQYHLFFQHNPHGLEWAEMHWGHATSPDLVHWTQKPMALQPGTHPNRLWSGNGVVDTADVSGLGAGALLVFTATEGVAVAYSTDGARTFQNYDNGRKLVVPPGTESRDPVVRWDPGSGRWVMVVWSNGGGNGGSFYTSPDLLNWTYRSRFGADWFFECPDFFRLPVDGDPARTRWVLTHAGGDYVIGTFDGTTFRPEWPSPQRMDHGTNFAGGTFYAGQTFGGVPDGRVVQLVWQQGDVRGAAWTGNASFPCELRLVSSPDGIRLTRTPVAEIALLRTGSQTWRDRTVPADGTGDPFAGQHADTYEILAEFDLSRTTARQFGFQLHRRPDGTADRTLTYDVAARTLDGRPLPAVDNLLELRLLVDRGQLEIFGNDGLFSWTDTVAFNSAADSQGIRLFATGGAVRVVSATLHRLGSAWGRGESTLDGNLAGPWTAVGAVWSDTRNGKQGNAGGDGFYLSATRATDFVYEGDVRLETARAVALTFRASADARQHYTACVDSGGIVKLWRPGRDIATARAAIFSGRWFHLKIEATGPRIRVHLDHRPVIDATDTAYATGLLGANVYSGIATVQNLMLNGPGLVSTLAGPWTPVSGAWTVPVARPGLHGLSHSDAFALSATSRADLTYEGDLTIVNGTAAALTFRANADASQHYTANIDAAGLVKLWRPGRDIATYATPIRQGRPYHLRVVATGARLQVFLDGGAAPVIDATDTAFGSGLLGVNVFRGSGVAQNLRHT
ncbi:hypothetical protein Val02_28700 [Virgisporangium aliadipatigenens]|uniref:Levanase n=1 Tax=Virgisporangium aliadipatigenens TaxID=741659 RepID=A0A8J4DPX5_9ACTN|nr:glycoside hydrolase family 32 protein [Virgisporangium aliadipatigenens]GIJ45984.1 hypothetical protein Val02_28700 [Virgisporangium aliadipatigenens]